MKNGIFITGTDTGIGKTLMTLGIALALKGQDRDVVMMKPLSCGPTGENDVLLYRRHLKLTDDPKLLNPYWFPLPAAPIVAAKSAKKKIDIQKITRAYKKLCDTHEIVLVEGVGGLMVPIFPKYTVRELILAFGAPTIVIARAGLGTLNHTIMTVEILKESKIPIIGIILNGFRGGDPTEKTNGKVIEEHTGISVLAEVPWNKKFVQNPRLLAINLLGQKKLGGFLRP